MVDKKDIEKYAKRNTSPKLPIEKKYVASFLESILFSDKMKLSFDELSSKTQNGKDFFFYNSYDDFCKSLDINKYGAVVAYSMLKKDHSLFEIIESLFFKGGVYAYANDSLDDLADIKDYTTDYNSSNSEMGEHEGEYFERTDIGKHTDNNNSVIQEGFQAYYCEDEIKYLGFYNKSEPQYPSSEEVLSKVDDFKKLISVVKPARIGVILMFVPYMVVYHNVTWDSRRFQYNLYNVTYGLDGVNSEVSTNATALYGISQSDLVDALKTVNCYAINKNGDEVAIPCSFDSYSTHNYYNKEVTFSIKVYKTEDLEKIFSKIEIKSNNPNYDLNYKIVPSVVLQQDMTNYYFCKIVITINTI